uniref:NACHT domain-containing protein n=1 Tax=Clytia hemisphaerica TaxID=252671 RepID=A0A7M5V3D0_9CNID
MSTYKSINQVIQEVQHWLRLAVFEHEPLKESVLYVLHNKGKDSSYIGLPSNPTDLYNELSTKHRRKIADLVKKGVLNKDQHELLLPTDGSNKTFSDKFDITLIVLAIRSFTTLPSPKGGWSMTPTPTDITPTANTIRARDWRNFLNHTNPEKVDLALFNQKWNEGVQIVQQIGYAPPDLNTLRTISLDPKHDLVLKSLHSLINNVVLSQQKNQSDITALQKEVSDHAAANNLMKSEINKNVADVEMLNKRFEDQKEDIAKCLEEQSTKRLEDQKEITKRLEEESTKRLEDQKEITKRLEDQAELATSDNQKLQLLDDRTELLVDQIQTITRKVDLLNDLKNEEQKIQSNDLSDFKRNCCKEVLTYVTENIGENWFQLLTLLPKRHGLPFVTPQDTNDNSPSQQLMDYFKSLAFQIKWQDLKNALEALDLGKMVDYIEQNTLITQGLQLASNKLRQRYVDDLIHWFLDQPLSTTNVGNKSLSREEAYIDLAVISSASVDREWSNSDRQTLMEQRYLEFESIEMQDIVKDTDQLVVVRGVAGVGKSSYIQMLALKWAKREIMNTLSNKIDFLFTFTCREINTLPDLSGIEDLLQKTYPKIFKYVTLSDLQMLTNRILIVVDGLDELSGMYQENPTNQMSNNAQVTMQIIDTKNIDLKGHKTIACGRPNACEKVQKAFSKTQHTKRVEVCGFRNAMIKTYVQSFFKNDTERLEKVLEVIKRSGNLQAMASVPIFLWVICSIYAEDCDIEIHSVTELYVYGLLVFLKNHLKGCMDIKNKTLQDIANSPTIGEIVYSLAKLSTKTYMKHQVIFTQDDMESLNCTIQMQQTGFITKLSTGNIYKEWYQFKHLSFQEFLSALYLCLSKGNTVFNQKRELSSCKQSIIGIHYLSTDGQNTVFNDLYKNLQEIHKRNSSFIDTLKAPLISLSYKSYLKDTLKWSKNLSQLIEDNYFYIGLTNRDFLNGFRESGFSLSKNQIKKFRYVSSAMIMMSHNLRHHQETILQLLDLLNITKIDSYIVDYNATEEMFTTTFYKFVNMIMKDIPDAELQLDSTGPTLSHIYLKRTHGYTIRLSSHGRISLPVQFLDYFKIFVFCESFGDEECIISIAKYVLKNKHRGKSISFDNDEVASSFIPILKNNLTGDWTECLRDDLIEKYQRFL